MLRLMGRRLCPNAISSSEHACVRSFRISSAPFKQPKLPPAHGSGNLKIGGETSHKIHIPLRAFSTLDPTSRPWRRNEAPSTFLAAVFLLIVGIPENKTRRKIEFQCSGASLC